MLQHFGAGVSYYLPSNLYLHAGLGLITIGHGVYAGDGIDHSYRTTWTEAGYAFRALLGKEWWSSANWAIGGAAQLQVGSVSDGADRERAAILGLHLSVTYN